MKLTFWLATSVWSDLSGLIDVKTIYFTGNIILLPTPFHRMFVFLVHSVQFNIETELTCIQCRRSPAYPYTVPMKDGYELQRFIFLKSLLPETSDLIYWIWEEYLHLRIGIFILEFCVQKLEKNVSIMICIIGKEF